MSVNDRASEPPRDPLPPFQAAGTTAQPMRNYCPLLRFWRYVVRDGHKRSTFPKEDAGEPNGARCGRTSSTATIFQRSTTNSIKFPVSG